MLIKKAYFGEFRHLLSILRSAARDGRAYVAFPKRKANYTTLFHQLREAGFLESYQDRGEILVVHLKQTYWKSFQLPVTAFSDVDSLSGRRRQDRSAAALKKMQLRAGHAVHTAVSTDQGLTSVYTAAASGLGGLPLFRIY